MLWILPINYDFNLNKLQSMNYFLIHFFSRNKTIKNTDISMLSTEEAQFKVETWIEKGLFIQIKNYTEQEKAKLFDGLDPTTEKFFKRHGCLRIASGIELIYEENKKWSEYVKGFLTIGHADDWDIIQKPGEPYIYIVEGSENSEREFELKFTSIYHLIVHEVLLAKLA